MRIPCDHREVRIELKADGFEPWIPRAEPLPVGGGERTIIASLRRDATLASLRIHFEDPDGDPLDYAELRAVPGIARLDERPMSAGIVLETTETLHFPALPAGPYRIGVRCPAFAPGEIDVQVKAGEQNEATLRLSEPAKMLLKFSATERLLVRFRFLHRGQMVPGFPEGQDVDPAEAGTKPLVVQGNEGTVFSGLPPGPLVVQVTSEDVVAAPRSVQMIAGETIEVDIEVRKR